MPREIESVRSPLHERSKRWQNGDDYLPINRKAAESYGIRRRNV